jgi:predicted ABC-type ATPase
MASLDVVTGPPGAGKSTVARVVADRFERSVLVEGDAFFAFLARDAVPPWLREANEQNEVVVKVAGAAAGRFAAEGYATVFDGVIGPWFLPTFAATAGLDFLHYIVLLPSLETCVARVRTRRGHGFTDEPATRKMYEEFARAEVDRRYVLADPSHDVEIVVREVLRRFDDGTLTYPS